MIVVSEEFTVFIDGVELRAKTVSIPSLSSINDLPEASNEFDLSDTFYLDNVEWGRLWSMMWLSGVLDAALVSLPPPTKLSL
jgi:hypothetical protein